jgi:hypothetical protein
LSPGVFGRFVDEADGHPVDFEDGRAGFRVWMFHAALRGECVYELSVFHFIFLKLYPERLRCIR